MYTQDEIKAKAAILTNHIKAESDGKCFITLKGIALACDVSAEAVKYAVTNPRHTLHNRLEKLGYKFTAPASVSLLIPDEAFELILTYFAKESSYGSRSKAKGLYSTVKAVGVRKWMQELIKFQPQVSLNKNDEDDTLIKALGVMAQQITEQRDRIAALEAHLGLNNFSLNKTSSAPAKQRSFAQATKVEREYQQAFTYAVRYLEISKGKASRAARYIAPLKKLVAAYAKLNKITAEQVWTMLTSKYQLKLGVDLQLRANNEHVLLIDYVESKPEVCEQLLQVAVEALA